MMLLPSRRLCFAAILMAMVALVAAVSNDDVEVSRPRRRILWDSDIDTDDLFGFFYLMKLNRSEFELEVSILQNQTTFCS